MSSTRCQVHSLTTFAKVSGTTITYPATKGVVVAQASPASDAAEKGLRRGDVITSVDRAPVTTVEQVSRAVAQAKTAGRKQVLLFVQRKAGGGFVVVDLVQG